MAAVACRECGGTDIHTERCRVRQRAGDPGWCRTCGVDSNVPHKHWCIESPARQAAVEAAKAKAKR